MQTNAKMGFLSTSEISAIDTIDLANVIGGAACGMPGCNMGAACSMGPANAGTTAPAAGTIAPSAGAGTVAAPKPFGSPNAPFNLGALAAKPR